MMDWVILIMQLIWVFMQIKVDQMVDLIKRLKLCVRWCVHENEKLQSAVESAVKKSCDSGIFLFSFFCGK